MNRLIKISKLLKLCQEENSAIWSAVLDEVNSPELPAMPELAALESSIKRAEELKRKAKIAAPTVENLSNDEFNAIRGLFASPDAMKSVIESAEQQGITQQAIFGEKRISKRAGIWSSFKGLVSGAFKFLPFVGVVWSCYEGFKSLKNDIAASSAIKNNFSDLGSEDQLFDEKYIGELISKHHSEPEQMLRIAKLNKIARFYKVEFLNIWADVAWFISDLITSAAIISSGGAVGAARGILGLIAMACGLGSVAETISVNMFGIMASEFDKNSKTIKEIAERASSGATQNQATPDDELSDV